MKFYKKLYILVVIFLSLANKSNADEILDLYKHLHSNPELSWQEFETSNLLANRMEDLGFKVTKILQKRVLFQSMKMVKVQY